MFILNLLANAQYVTAHEFDTMRIRAGLVDVKFGRFHNGKPMLAHCIIVLKRGRYAVFRCVLLNHFLLTHYPLTFRLFDIGRVF